MNLNELAKEVAKRESGKKQVSIAQIKEILRHLGDIELEEYIKIHKVELEDVYLEPHPTPIFKIMRAALKRARK